MQEQPSFFGRAWADAPFLEGKEMLHQRLLDLRGLEEHAEIEAFLRPRLGDLPDPFVMHGMGTAVDRTVQALDGGERIMVFGDFDADGITSTVILVHGLRALGADVSYRIPERTVDSHGLKKHLLDEIATKGTKLVITCDCGINDAAEVEYAASLGMDTIVTDHHQPDEKRFPATAVAVLNPHLPQCQYPTKELSGAGIAFKFLCGLAQQWLKAEKLAQFLDSYLEICAIGLVADCVPLVGENRTLVQVGLRKMQTTQWGGLAQLLEKENVAPENINEETVGFVIAPRLNAASRLGDVLRATEFFLGDPSRTAERLEYLNRLNEKRKVLTLQMVQQARALVEPGKPVQCLHRVGWEPGVLGLVAGRLSEELQVGVVASTLRADGVVAASARAPQGSDMVGALGSCGDLFLNFGGHDAAAGFQCESQNLEAVYAALEKFFAAQNRESHPTAVAAWVEPEVLDLEVALFLSHLGPYGMGNPKPIFGLKNLEVREKRMVGKDSNHLQLVVGSGSWKARMMGFFWDSLADGLAVGDRVDVLCTFGQNLWQGEMRPEFQLVDVRKKSH